MNGALRGSCEDFCPPGEKKLRIKERLLHFYELKNGQKNVPGTLVKAFSRSAAGIKTPKASDLRTERCLRLTIEYLLNDIILDKRKPYNAVYDFVFDRLRAVRQEMVMQNYSPNQTIQLTEPIIFFLAYSNYRLCMEPIDVFDPKICQQHLQECLKKVLCCYDETESAAPSTKSLENRNFIESIYQVLNLGSMESLRRCITLPIDIRSRQPFHTVYSIVMNFHRGNLYRVFVGFLQLPHILSAVAALKLQIIRKKLFTIFAIAYNNSRLTVPIEFIRRVMVYSDDAQLISDINYYNLTSKDSSQELHFTKENFNSDAVTPSPRHEKFVDKNFQNLHLPQILLLKEL